MLSIKKLSMTSKILVYCLFCAFFSNAKTKEIHDNDLSVSWNVDRHRRAVISTSLFHAPECPIIRDLCGYIQDTTDDLMVLGCVQNLKSSQVDTIPERCQNVIWNHISRLIEDENLKNMASKQCGDEQNNLLCGKNSQTTKFLSCMLDNRGRVNNVACKSFIQRIEWVAFSDFRTISTFLEHCQANVQQLSCGRLNKNNNAASTQDRTLSCLQSNINVLSKDCKKEVLHLSEMQSDNIKYDRQLYLACSMDQLRFCPDLLPGSGKIYKCLTLHKFDHGMTQQCQEQLSRRQKLIAQDYKVSRGLAKACKEDIRTNRCRKGVSDDKDIRLAQILICLENVLKNNTKVSQDCQAEMIDHRKMLMEDYRLSPEILQDCAGDIAAFCNAVESGGRTIHCLMEHARPRRKLEGRIRPECQRSLETLVKETDAGEDWRVDPILRQACKPVVDAACKEVTGGEGRVMSCLMEKLGKPVMTEDCETALIQIQYFIARDFKLDPQLYKACKDDAANLCHAKQVWADDDNKMGPERGPLILPCLYRYAYNSESNLKLQSTCLQEIKRVMRQRAVSVELQPEIEEVCLDDLALFCFDLTAKGEEMLCLQKNLENLQDKCKLAVSNFTEAQAGHIELNPIVSNTCKLVIEKHCSSFLSMGKDEGNIMECLISHKNEPDVRADTKCRAAIEHFQLISLKNYRFTYKFKEACRSYVVRFCPQAKTKNQVVTCLSETVRNDTIDGNRHSISKECRQQLKNQLFQQRENIDYDPKLKFACKEDLNQFCSNIQPGAAQALECLQTFKGKLSNSCQRAIFNVKKQEFLDNSVDYNLMSTCKSMIKLFCHDTLPSKVLDCLKIHKDEAVFEDRCKLVVVHRMIEQNSDYRFNPILQSACKPDIKKFCAEIIAHEPQDQELQGKVVKCLKNKYRESKLTTSCQHQLAEVLKEQALNYRLDPLISTMCKFEIDTICKSVNSAETSIDGEVEECLKQAFVGRNIPTPECANEVASLIDGARADIGADPLLQRACTVDLLKYCSHLTHGAGRHIKCLQVALADSTKELEIDCKAQLTRRLEMFRSASEVLPLQDFGDLYDQVNASPAKKISIIDVVDIFGDDIHSRDVLWPSNSSRNVHEEEMKQVFTRW